MIVDGRFPTLTAAAAMLALALWVLAVRPRDSLHRILALFLFLRAAMYALVSFSSPFWDLEGRLMVYAMLAVPFAAVAVALAFWQRHGPPHRRIEPGVAQGLRWGLLAGAVALELVYLADHSTFATRDQAGPLQLMGPMTYLTYAAIALVLAVAGQATREPERRRGLLLMALAFALEPAFRTGFHVVDGTPNAASLPYGIPGVAILWAGLAASVAVAVILARTVEGRGMGLLRASPVALAVGSGALVALMPAWADVLTVVHTLWVLDAFWHLALVGLAVVAVLRYEVLTLDLKFKTAVQRSAVGAVFAFAFFAASEWLEEVVPVQGEFLGMAAAVLIAVALRPIQHGASRLASALMPGVEDDEEHLAARRAAVYEAALTTALEDEHVTHRERLFLDRLAEQLGLPPEEAAALEERLERARRVRAPVPAPTQP